MIPQDEVDSLGILAFERGHHVEQLVRAVAGVVGIHVRSVDQLLQHEMTTGMAIERGEREDFGERRQVAVQIADDHHVGCTLEGDDSTCAAGVERMSSVARRMVVRSLRGSGIGNSRQ